ncbi:MAG: hypothetical protein OXU20_11655, partial [Myxococcales bacterium]|nr:hypothetical protein [Myxococcales bacterium]
MESKDVAPIYAAYHWLKADEPERAHAGIQAQIAIEAAQPGRARATIELETIEEMVAVGATKAWPASQLTQYRTFYCWLSAVLGIHEKIPPEASMTLDGLSHFGGLEDYLQLTDVAPEQRLQAALARATARCQQTPEADMPLPPPVALGALTRVGALTATCGYLMAEPELFPIIPSLKPLDPLSPAFGFADRLILAFRDLANGKIWVGWEALRKIYDDVGTLSDDQLEPHNRFALELASLSGLCSFEVKYGTANALRRCDELARMQPDSAENYRMLYYLAIGHQEEADACRKRSEILALRAGATDDTRVTRLLTHMVLQPIAEDVMGLEQTLRGLDEIVRNRPGWRHRRNYTQARALRCRGRLDEALQVIEASLAEVPKAHIDYLPSAEEHVLLLTATGRGDEAARVGDAYLNDAHELELPAPWLELAVALCHMEQGDPERAQRHCQSAFDGFAERQIEGIHVGYAHEVAARIALSRKDRSDFERHLALCARYYLEGRSPALAVKYDRLVQAARAVEADIELPTATTHATTELADLVALRSRIEHCESDHERFQEVLSLLCEYAGARAGVLFGLRRGSVQALTDEGALGRGLTAFAQSYLSAEVDSSAEATLTMADNAGELAAALDNGYASVLLRAEDADGELIAGLAVLDAGDEPIGALASDFLGVLAELLLEHGELEFLRAA